ncbi:MAG TPA: ATP-binding protein, partial [Dehalococcoidia bacterium]|nr:ATP-binding protein [Dehalococcoidia bacterium]
FEQEDGILAKLDLTHTVRPPRDVAVAVYRIFHEALINIRKHAQASEVTVTLRCEQDEVGLQVEDNGAGFNVSAIMAEHHVGGLMSMQRRAEMAQGKFRIESKPGKGTRITARVPWPKRRQGDRVAVARARVA